MSTNPAIGAISRAIQNTRWRSTPSNVELHVPVVYGLQTVKGLFDRAGQCL